MVTVQSMSPLLFKLPFFSIIVLLNVTQFSFCFSATFSDFAYAQLCMTLEN